MSLTSETLRTCDFLIERLYRRFVLGTERGSAACTVGARGRERAGCRAGHGSVLRQLSDEALLAKLARARNNDDLIAELGCSRAGFYQRLARARGRGKVTR